MLGYLIKDTTVEERKKIVEESLGNISADCDGCMSGLAEMYQDYIEGKREIRDINMEFNAPTSRDGIEIIMAEGMSEETWTKRSEEAVRCDLSRIGRILILKCGLWGNRDEEKIN